MKVVAIIQARMGSSRLPGKVLKTVLNKPLLEHQIERIREAKLIDEIVIATTFLKQDDPIVSLCEKLNVPYYRGSEIDVLERYHEAALSVKAQAIIRITSDCPIIDPLQIDKVVQVYLSVNDISPLRYVSNTLQRTYPRGMDTEVFSFSSLREAHIHAHTLKEREHVTPYMTSRPTTFSLTNVPYKNDESHHRWTVDTPEDLLLIKKIIEHLYPQSPLFTMERVLDLLNRHPQWMKINAHIAQKEG
ncbi:cytidylyltransferase domain-containing protein [Halobacillus sp. Marseille-Q1614]|uniref:cytidylyltransferase domain-containing protein n=1 Tax=Halobacillus sp. Marseille-Q1614 TaxID=2709134 RepID=UPI00156E59F5|nr:glycosyltransferase family protein [Halobacillus sp. Marseille-Q1614]